MQVGKAIRPFVQDLRLSPEEQALVCAMFTTNDVVLRGQETVIPIVEATAALGLGDEVNQRVLVRLGDHLASIMDATYRHDMGGRSVSFRAISSLSVNRGTAHIVFTANRNTCSLIRSLAQRAESDTDDDDQD